MALVLLAGLLSVKHLEGRLGAPTVSGIVLVELPGVPADVLDQLQTRWPGARLEWVTAGSGEPFGPFEDFSAYGDEGVATVLFSSRHLDRESTHDKGWSAVLDGWAAQEGTPITGLTDQAAAFVRGQESSRPFLVGMDLGRGADMALAADALAALVDAAQGLPSFRRTAIVALGARDHETSGGQGGRRWCLRIPVGSWEHHALAGLADLLEPGS